MFKDFNRRLQRDLKRIVDARIVTSDAQLKEDLKVISELILSLHLMQSFHNDSLLIVLAAVSTY